MAANTTREIDTTKREDEAAVPDGAVTKSYGRRGGETRAPGRHNRGGLSETKQPTGNPSSAEESKN